MRPTNRSATRTHSSPDQPVAAPDLFDEVHRLINEAKSILPAHAEPSTLDNAVEEQVSFDDVLREFEARNHALSRFVNAAVSAGGLVDACHALNEGSQGAKEKIGKFYSTAKQLQLTWPEIREHAKLAAIGNPSAEELKKLSLLMKIGEKFGSRLFYNPDKQ
jgi:hypothetical protein